MKKISARRLFLLVLAAILALGALVFFVEYFISADRWVAFSGSPHLYTGANLNCGVVVDSSGEALLDTRQGRTYSENAGTRKAFLHLLGDRDGFISAPMLGAYAETMIGYNKFTGLYGAETGGALTTLTVSAAAQRAAMQALEGYRGTIGVYNYKTGEILCAVSSPSYDPDNVPDVSGDETGAYEGVYVNRFFDVTYTPGSIFKLVTSVAAIDTISDIYQQTFTCTGKQIIGGQEIICSGVHGQTNFSEGLAHSCNIVFGNIAEQLGAKTLERYARRLGLGESFDCAGYHTKSGSVDLSKADAGDTAWAGIGQYSIEVNPYAYLRFMGILGGGGEAAEPYLVKSITEGDKTLYSAQRTSTGQLASSTAAEKMATMMHYNVVTIYGTQQFPPYYVCAKSGTAEQAGKPAHATFAGFIRDDEYPLAFVVFVENAGAGSAVAAPMAGKVLTACVDAMQK